MSLIELVRGAVQRLEARPRWLRWLETAPPAVRSADERFRRTFVRFQLPCAGLVVCVFAAAKNYGLLAPPSIASFWLLLAGMVALSWPVPILRLAVAAHRGANAADGLAARLRALSAGASILGALIVVCLVALVALTARVTLNAGLPWF